MNGTPLGMYINVTKIKQYFFRIKIVTVCTYVYSFVEYWYKIFSVVYPPPGGFCFSTDQFIQTLKSIFKHEMYRIWRVIQTSIYI